MNTGFQSLDASHFSKFDRGGCCLVTGQCKDFINSVFTTMTNSRMNITIVGQGTQSFISSARNKLYNGLKDPSSLSSRSQYISTTDAYGQELLSNCYYNRGAIVDKIRKDSVDDASILFVFIDSSEITEDHYVFAEYCSKSLAILQSRTVFIISTGKFDSTVKKKEDLFKIYAHLTETNKNEYDVDISSNFNGKCSGTHSIKIEPDKTSYDILNEGDVILRLYDLCYPSDKYEVHHGTMDLKKLLRRYKDITGKERPGFMK